MSGNEEGFVVEDLGTRTAHEVLNDYLNLSEHRGRRSDHPLQIEEKPQ